MPIIEVRIDHYIHWVTNDPRLDKILANTEIIKEQNVTNAQAFAELKTKFDDLSTAVGDGLTNITADLQKLIAAKDTLDPASAQIVTDLEASFTKMATDVKNVADIVPDDQPQP